MKKLGFSFPSLHLQVWVIIIIIKSWKNKGQWVDQSVFLELSIRFSTMILFLVKVALYVLLLKGFSWFWEWERILSIFFTILLNSILYGFLYLSSSLLIIASRCWNKESLFELYLNETFCCWRRNIIMCQCSVSKVLHSLDLHFRGKKTMQSFILLLICRSSLWSPDATSLMHY